MKRVSLIIAAGLLAITLARTAAAEEDYAALRAQVTALGDLAEAPTVYPAEGFSQDRGIKPVFYEGPPWQGKPTRVFAWLGVPESHGAPLPGIVLVHGGGGTAFKEWVARWNAHGFAAISMATEGQTDVRKPDAPRGAQWERHAWAGPAREGIYADSSAPLKEQWMYHAVADTVLANSLLRSLPEVDPERVGVAGISWGGVITSTVIGIDARFAFAIPIYGCGHLFDAGNQWGQALGNNMLYREVWDPMVRMGRARMPVLWLSWPGDQHFPLDCQRACYRAAPGPGMVSLIPGMGHSHPAGWNPPDSYAFAESIVIEGSPWLKETYCAVKRGEACAEFESRIPLDSAKLIWTADTGFTGNREWNEAPAVLEERGGVFWVHASFPETATAWFINVRAGDLTASSTYRETTRNE